MSELRIFTDSTADIPLSYRQELGIGVVPLKVHIDGNSYLDGETLLAEEFYKILPEASQLPSTSQPSPHEFCEAYREAAKNGAKQILSIHISSRMSGTVQSARLAKEMVAEEGIDVTVLDSRTVCLPLGMIVIAAARAAKKGKSLEECVALVEKYREHQHLFFLVDTLEYLQKGGRIGKASALVGSLLNIKPVMSINPDGEVYAVEKVRGKKKAFRRIVDLMGQAVKPGSAVRLGIMHADNLEEVEKDAKHLLDMYDVKEKVLTTVGPVVGTHAGPKVLGYVIYPILDEEL
jgi:DegV family protein with EDD domain